MSALFIKNIKKLRFIFCDLIFGGMLPLPPRWFVLYRHIIYDSVTFICTSMKWYCFGVSPQILRWQIKRYRFNLWLGNFRLHDLFNSVVSPLPPRWFVLYKHIICSSVTFICTGIESCHLHHALPFRHICFKVWY